VRRKGGSAVKIRLWGTADECRQMTQLLIETSGFDVVSVSEPYADRGASVLVRVFIEARLDPSPLHVASAVQPRARSQHEGASQHAQRTTRRRQALPPGDSR
jgi:hypothetical protein